MKRLLDAVPFSQAEYHAAATPLDASESYKDYGGYDVARAVQFFVRCRQSLAGRMKSFAPVTRNRTRRGMNEQVSSWLNAIDGLAAVHARLKRVLLLGPREALDVIRSQDGARTLFYLDPPYLHATRAAPNVYALEMSVADHADLLVRLGGPPATIAAERFVGPRPTWWARAEPIAGRFLLSGYRSELYDAVAAACSWHRHETTINNHAAGGKTKRRMTECLWANF
jgi:DNA adenine methylase